MTPTTSDADAQVEEDRGRKMDPELRAIAALLRIMDDVPPHARPRVASYFVSRYVTEARGENR